MNTKMRLLAVPTLALSALALSAAPALAADHGQDSWSSQATLSALNNSGTAGDVMVDVHGNQATV
ncbi:hypothetical protein RCG68_17975, partial [Kocuria sp. CPCC 205290]